MSRITKAKSVLFACMATALAACLFVLSAQALEIRKAEGLLNDFAHILSGETKEYIESVSGRAYDKCDVAIVVTTIDSLDGEDIDSYANAMAREWKIEKGGKGILILLALEDKEVKIEVSEGLEGDLNDAKAGRIIRGATELLKAEDYDRGLLQIYNAVVGEVCDSNLIESDEPWGEAVFSHTPLWVKVLGLIIFMALCIRFKINPFIALQIVNFRGNSPSSRNFGDGGKFGGGSRFGGGGAKGKF